jgi:hypothetical protein
MIHMLIELYDELTSRVMKLCFSPNFLPVLLFSRSSKKRFSLPCRLYYYGENYP